MRRSSIVLMAACLCAAGAQAQTAATLLRSGSNGSKLNLVIIGDGFTAAQQGAFNARVDTLMLRELFNETTGGVFRETMTAFNIIRVNANSVQSGVTLVDSTGAVTWARNTFWDWRYSGAWSRCWMEPGPNTNARISAALDTLVPGWDFVFVMLNTTSGGGCRRGNQVAVTMGSGWATAAHEMGHMVGNLGDTYAGDTNTYTGAEPSRVNLTINLNRATLKWRDWVPASRPIPTLSTFGGDNVRDVGVFEGATTSMTRFNFGIFRSSNSDRMRSNTPDFDPVSYTQMQESVDGQRNRSFRRMYVGKFTGSGRTDAMLHTDNSIRLLPGFADTLGVQWVRTLPDPVWDDYRPGDRFYPGDFDGDGRDDLLVVNMTDWSMPYLAILRSTGTGFEGIRRFDRELPGWGDMRVNDQFFVGDFDGDGKADVYVFNGRDWAMGYLLMLRSTGNTLQFVRRFDGTLPGWGDMRRNDRFFVADFDADRRRDLYVFNGRDWAIGYLEMLRSTGNNLSFVRRFDEELPGWDDMRQNDDFFVGDFDNDQREDLYVWNGPDWSMAYLGMLRSTGSNLSMSRRFDRDCNGWGEMRRNDKWMVADIDGNGRRDLYVYNALDWSTQYLGAMRSTGANLQGGWQDDWIGSWNLGSGDEFRVANFNGGSGFDDLIVLNDNWLGLLRSTSTRVTNSAIYPKWIKNHVFHRLGWW
jgi:hypothetical protein